MVRALRWISLLATAVPLGATVAHVMELPNKLTLDGPLWLAVQQNLYSGWGPFIAPFEIVAIVSSWALAAGGVFPVQCAPVNAAFAGWTTETLPADWPDYRLQWELGHAIAFALALTAFCTLLRAAFAEACARRGAIERPAASVDQA